MQHENLTLANKAIYDYWLESKHLVPKQRLKKKFKGTFTRHKGKVKLSLIHKNAWRFSNGIRNNEIKTPSIGYKRAKNHRFRRAADGLLFLTVNNVKDLTEKKLTKPYMVYEIAKSVAGKKRLSILEEAKKLKLPLYIKRPYSYVFKSSKTI